MFICQGSLLCCSSHSLYMLSQLAVLVKHFFKLFIEAFQQQLLKYITSFRVCQQLFSIYCFRMTRFQRRIIEYHIHLHSSSTFFIFLYSFLVLLFVKVNSTPPASKIEFTISKPRCGIYYFLMLYYSCSSFSLLRPEQESL